MQNLEISPETLKNWRTRFPQLNALMAAEEVFWCNPRLEEFERSSDKLPLTGAEVTAAEQRLARFAPYIAEVFQETRSSKGLIESPLLRTDTLAKAAGELWQQPLDSSLFLKADNRLAVSGSIKARGGIYEVLKHAEHLALKSGILRPGDDYRIFAEDRMIRLMGEHAIAVGSTGNLGLSIGIIGTQLGFKVFVHMSAEAQTWKKELLRNRGATVIEHDSDYTQAVAEGRRQAQGDRRMHFIDDEQSPDLCLGYAVAAGRLAEQLRREGIPVDRDHPLFVYLPCGVGGGPGGITFGLKLAFRDHVHCFFAEPVQSPCMLLGLMTGLHDRISVTDIGLENRTEADGLAVTRPSRFVCRTLEHLISGVFTVSDDTLHAALALLATSEDVLVEPSAAAGIPGPFRLLASTSGHEYIAANRLEGKMANATHIIWATGGSMVPAPVMARYLAKGAALLNRETE